MPITEKTRKILWGRSGNRYAFCRQELVIEAKATDDESVVGDECHVVSGKCQGPRHDPTFPPARLHEPENLILLCRVHHKMADDQCDTYTVEALQKLKMNHEKWVSTTLGAEKEKEPRPVQLRRIKKNVPSCLTRLTSGQGVTNVVGGACAFAFTHDEPESDAEADLVVGFLQDAQDWGDLWEGLEAGERVKAAYGITALLRELEQAGFWVFGSQEIRRLEGGGGAPTTFPVAILRILRSTNPDIVTLDPQAESDRRKS